MEMRWTKGVFLGVKDGTDEVFVGMGEGVVTARSIKKATAHAET